MKLFKYGWFSSKERDELVKKNQDLEERLKSLEQKVQEKGTAVAAEKPYKNLFYSGNQITVVFRDGSVLSVGEVDGTTFNRVESASTAEEVRRLLAKTVEESKIDTRTETVEERRVITNNLDVLRNLPNFEIEGANVMLKGVKLPMPAMVIESFVEILEKRSLLEDTTLDDESGEQYDDLTEQYEALRSFWLKLALNGLEQSRTDLLRFVKENDVHITRNGNLVLYRRIVKLGEGNTELLAFVSKEYYKIKKWKKSPRNFFVYQENNHYICKHIDDSAGMDEDKIIGNLGDLYVDLPNLKENVYTSAHNKGMHTIKIGQIYKINEDGICLDNGLCAAGGLHAAAVNYDYSGFGDTPVVVLVNPSKAITVPTGEIGKLRTTEMFIACVNDKRHGEHFDEHGIFAFDEEYNDLSIQELEKAVAAKDFSLVTVENQLDEPSVTIQDMKAIKDLLKDRITII